MEGPGQVGPYGFGLVMVAAICYGSHFVPMKRHENEVHDSVVYQWYQCSGVMACGVVVALLTNDWGKTFADANLSFCVAPEGFLAGLVYHTGNVLSLEAVRLVGLRTYFTTHEITNLGGAYVIGLLGKQAGLPVRAIPHEGLAALGVACMLLGFVAAAFMRPPRARPRSEGSVGSDFVSDGSPRAWSSKPETGPGARSAASARSALLAGGESRPDSVVSEPMCFHAGEFLIDQNPPRDALLPEMNTAGEAESSVRGLGLSLLSGTLYASMWLPMLTWRNRMSTAGVVVRPYDFAFSVCVGLYCTSTLWLLCGHAWKQYRGLQMDKSVLRPAFLGGFVWALAMVSQLHAFAALPYTVAYCSTVGGAFLVSLLWGVAVFGEAASSRNCRCVAASFVGMLAGIALLGLSVQ